MTPCLFHTSCRMLLQQPESQQAGLNSRSSLKGVGLGADLSWPSLMDGGLCA